jgi:hypothetical protein
LIDGHQFSYYHYPNLFSTFTTIRYELPFDASIQLTVFDVSGKEIKTLIKGFRPAGIYITDFSGENLKSGIYIYKLTTNLVMG